jgi:orotate phosphoribosyltransferase
MNSIDVFKILLSIQAIKIDTDNPFTFSSGIRSPIYCDNRILISHPEQRRAIIDAYLERITATGDFDVIAGTATAGIPHAAWIADRLNKPMIYVRSKAKSHGTKNQIEGQLKPGQKVCLIEDLISTGASALNAAQAIREMDAECHHCFAIFNYDLLATQNAFNEADIKVQCLAHFEDCLNHNDLFNDTQKAALNQWRASLSV